MTNVIYGARPVTKRCISLNALCWKMTETMFLSVVTVEQLCPSDPVNSIKQHQKQLTAHELHLNHMFREEIKHICVYIVA